MYYFGFVAGLPVEHREPPGHKLSLCDKNGRLVMAESVTIKVFCGLCHEMKSPHMAGLAHAPIRITILPLAGITSGTA